MDLQDGIETSESRCATYVETLASALAHADRVAPLKAYCTGLLLPGDRKSVGPMAARVEPGRVQAAHQSLHHFVAKADWSDDAVLGIVRAQVLPALERQGPVLWTEGLFRHFDNRRQVAAYAGLAPTPCRVEPSITSKASRRRATRACAPR